jgi:putative ABC transport system permease protein
MQTFLKISLRHLWQSRLYSFINILGLATAIACMLLAVLYWKDERSYDDFHKNNPNLYRIVTNVVNKEGRTETTGGTGQVQGPAFHAGVPEVKSYVRILGGDIYSDVAAGDKTLHLQPLFVDKNFFDVFTFQLLRGNPATALNDIASVVITETTSRKFFNSIDVVGKLLQMDADPSFEKLGKPLIVSGVVKDPPANSSLQFDALFTFDFMHLSFEDTNWLNAYLGTFIILHPGADIKAVLDKFNKIYAFHAKEQLADKDFNIHGYDPRITYNLQRVTDIHLNPLTIATGNAEGGIINISNPVYSYLFMGIALFILLMAAINFINISIANSLKRAKEVGVRKIAGGSRLQIIMQFLNESAILCFVAFLLSVVLMNISLPLFNSLTGKQLLFAEAVDAKILVYFIMLLAVIILLTGLYPAYVLSNFKPSEVLYNKQKLSGRNLFGRSLVVIQFSLAVFLLMATIVYYNQMNYIRTKDLGYNPSQVIRTAVGGNRDYKTVINVLKNELAKEPSVKMVSFGNDGYSEEMQVNNRNFKAVYKNIDENFLPTLEIPVKGGRNLSSSFPGDTKDGVIVNETFVKAAGMQDPLGKQVKIKINWGYDSTIKTIKAVVKDFHFGSLREPIQPMVMYMNEFPDGGIWIKFEKSKQKEAMTAVERIYNKTMPGAVYQFNFLDELNARQYLQEQRWKKVISIATTLSFIICCLGLFGLAHLSTNKRIKEIGIRKVLGASVSQIVALLSGDFLKLVLVAFVIAAPIAWVVMNKWLQDFAYRITIGPAVFIIAAVIAVIIALVAVSSQAIKTALTNPVKSLRTE